MSKQYFNCPACGGPNEPLAGASRMPCAYCGANLEIPAHLQRKAESRPQTFTPKIETPSVDASEVLRQAQPLLTSAWNTYAYWSWARRLLPACLTIVIITLLACMALGLLPVWWALGR